MIKAALIGAGGRGKNVYANYAIEHPNEIQFIAVAEPNEHKRNEFAKLHRVSEDMTFESWEQLLDRPKFCDAVFICTQDRMHFEPAMKAIDKGYKLLLEKPMSNNLEECIKIVEASKNLDTSITVAHVLRYTQFYKKLKQIIDSRIIGEVVNINLNENVGYYHYAHSYVRGNWCNSETSSPMILAKSCHDMDILVWLIGKKPLNISSFGSLKYFKEKYAPEGSGERCLNCAVEENCPYSALKIYLTNNNGWPVNIITTDLSMEGRIKALKEGPYGKCVFRSSNNVVDHQVVNIQFEDEVTAAFTMSGFTNEITRKITVMGTLGEAYGDMDKNEVSVKLFGTGEVQHIKFKSTSDGHGGGDSGLMKYYTRQLKDDVVEGLTSAEISLLSHVMAFAAEQSRVTGETIDLHDFIDGGKHV
jgi:predicted dehydrogenase